MVRWANSSAARDLNALQDILQEWPEDVVLRHLAEWREKLETGKHFPLVFGGLRGKT